MDLTPRDNLVVAFLVVVVMHFVCMILILVDQRVQQRVRVPIMPRVAANRLFISLTISALLFSFAAFLALPTKQYRVERTFDTVIVRTITTGHDSDYYVELVRGRDTVPYQIPVFCDMGAPYISYTRHSTSYADTANAVVRRLVQDPTIAYNTKCPERTVSLSAPVSVSERK